jgi:hypothetical protein
MNVYIELVSFMNFFVVLKLKVKSEPFVLSLKEVFEKMPDQ